MIFVVAAVVLAMGVGSVSAEDSDWPADVKGHKKVKRNEHPRLLFRQGDLEALRRRAKTDEGQAILKRLREQLNGSDGESMPTEYQTSTKAYQNARKDLPVGAYTLWHGAGFGFLYRITGEPKYADLGRKCVEKAMQGQRDRDDRYAFVNPGGFLRAGPSVGAIAMAYDLCYDGWDEDFRVKVAKAIQNYDGGHTRRDGGGQQTMKRLATKPKFMPGSNHYGMQVAGAALAMLAIAGDDGTDDKLVKEYLDAIEKNTIANFTKGFGDHGWFAEGDGTGVMSSHIAFLYALQAWRVTAGKDFTSPRPNCRYPVLKFVVLTIPRDGKPDFPSRGAYPHNVWCRTGVSGPGTFCGGFGVVNEDEKPALLWLYNRVSKELDAKAGGPFETSCEYPYRSIAAFVNWPMDMQEDNPIRSVRPYLHDKRFGFFAFRDGWKDENDILITCQPEATRGWHRANKEVGDVWVWAYGRKGKFGRCRGKVTHFEGYADGSGTVTVGETAMGVDFSGACGTDAMVVMCGKGAGKGKTVSAGGNDFSFMFLGEKLPTPKADGEKVVVGEQTVQLGDGNIVFGKTAGPWKPAGEKDSDK